MKTIHLIGVILPQAPMYIFLKYYEGLQYLRFGVISFQVTYTLLTLASRWVKLNNENDPFHWGNFTPGTCVYFTQYPMQWMQQTKPTTTYCAHYNIEL